MSKKSKKINKIEANTVNTPVEEVVTEEVTETTAEAVETSTEKVVETVVEETTSAVAENAAETTADESVTQEKPEDTVPPTEDEQEKFKNLLRRRFFVEAGVSMKTYAELISSVSFGLLSEEVTTPIAELLFEQLYKEDKTSYNMKAIEAFIKFGLMGRTDSANHYLPEDREVLISKVINYDDLTIRQDEILSKQLDNMLSRFIGLAFAKPIFSPDDNKRQEKETAKAKAKAEKAEKKSAKAAEKATKKESKKKTPETAASSAANPQEKPEEKLSVKDRFNALRAKNAAKKAAKNKEETVQAEPCTE